MLKEIVLVRICERSVEACNVCEEDRRTMKTSGYRASYSRSETSYILGTKQECWSSVNDEYIFDSIAGWCDKMNCSKCCVSSVKYMIASLILYPDTRLMWLFSFPRRSTSAVSVGRGLWPGLLKFYALWAASTKFAVRAGNVKRSTQNEERIRLLEWYV